MAPMAEGQLNLANLNLLLPVPVVAKAGAGMPFSYTLVYNSAVWRPVASSWQPATNFGWNAETNPLTGYETYQATSNQCGYGYPTQMYSFTIYAGFAYTDAFGVQHDFPLVIQYPTGLPCGPQYASSGTAVATDGSGYTLTASTSGGAPYVSLSSASGQGISAPLFLAGSPITPAPNSVTDPNGNKISTDGSGNFYDTLGLKALAISGSQSPNGSMTFTYSVAGGATAQLVVRFGSYSVRTNFGCAGVSEYSKSSVPLVSEIDLPDGTSYTFGYEATPGYSGDVTARIASIKLPTGGTISYGYSGGSNGVVCADGSTATLTRTLPDGGRWTYAHAESGHAWTTAVTDPSGDVTNYSFQDIYQTERQVNSGSSTTLETVFTCYNGAVAPCNSTSVTLPITKQAVTTQTDTNLQSSAVTSFNAYGLPTEVDEYGWGSGAVGPLFRKTLTQYASLGAIVDRPASVQVTDGSGTQRALTNYSYDSRGNTLTVSRWVAGANYDTTTYTVNPNGTVATAKDPRGYTTTYSYGSGSCNGAFPTNVTLPSNLTTAATWDCGIALPTAVTGVDGQTTTFHYGAPGAPDPFARITQIDAPGPSAGSPREAVIQYSDTSNQVDRWISTTSDSLPASDSGYRHERDIADSLGREIEHDLVNDPAGLTRTLTTYDSLGRVATVTNPFRQTTDPTYGITKYSYDALGRATAITNPDNSVTTLAYGGGVTGAGGLGTSQCSAKAYPVLSDSAAGRPSQVWLDADGNVLETDEPNQSSGSMTSGELATCYTYTTLDQLATVSQGGQQRSLDYDGLGEMLYSRFPESAANIAGPADGFGNTNWSEALTYDADGNVLTRKDADGVTTTFGYDALNRLTSETFSDSTPGRYFIYDSTTGCTLPSGANVTYSTGRLVCAGLANTSQYNLISHDPAGEAIETWDQGPAGSPAHQAYAYFFNGQFSSYTNPNGNVFTYALDNPGRIVKLQADGTWNGGETVFGGATFTPL
ncbi:MAG TPA: hypothetical protein VE996_04710, partial [Terriglobales bacterium]|nr:hypothetical protein [Terriglobales bacterium]